MDATVLALVRESVGGVIALALLVMIGRWLPKFHAAFDEHNRSSQRMAEAVEQSAEAVEKSMGSYSQTAEATDALLIAVRALSGETDSQGKRLAQIETLLREALTRLPK